MTDAHCSGEVVSATNTRSDIYRVGDLGTLASAMQLLQASLVPQIREEARRVYVPIKGVYTQAHGSESPSVL